MTLTRTLAAILTAGAFGTIAFDVFGQALSPLLGHARLAPVGLAGASLKAIFGANPAGAAHLLHYLTGIVFYAMGYALVARPLQKAVLPGLPWQVTAVAYGIVLWVFAVYVMAHLVAGNAPFLGWTGITWVAFWGHIVYAAVAAWVMESRGVAITLPVARPLATT